MDLFPPNVGHAFWEMRCRPVPESVEGISNSDFLNKRVGFYGDGFHVPDTDHQPEVVKMLPISRAKFSAGAVYCLAKSGGLGNVNVGRGGFFIPSPVSQ